MAAVVGLAAAVGWGLGWSADRTDLEAAFRAWDRDGDGRLAESEWRGRAPFGRVDLDGDGFVTLEELVGRTPSAPADSPPGPDTASRSDGVWARMVQGWDDDGDGALSAAEWRGRTPHGSFDLDGDGVVTGEEFSAAVISRSDDAPGPTSSSWARALASWDANGDGALTAGEWQGVVPFEQLDADGNGRLVEEELLQSVGVAGDTGDGAATRGPEVAPDAGTSEEFELLLRAMDTNRDGRVSRDEWNGGASDWEGFDADRNGFITAEEVP